MPETTTERRRLLAAGLGLALGAVLPSHGRGGDDALKLRTLYEKDGAFSDLARALEGERVAVLGYMAPPLRADTRFFVLTKRPMAVCPFCESAAEWPDDILAVYAKRRVDVEPFNVRLETRGRLALGVFEDPDTGFVSRVRLEDAVYERAW